MTKNKESLLLINASPRLKGTSVMLLHRIQRVTGGELVHLYQGEITAVLEKMKSAEKIVISGPCYVNSYPSRVVHLLEEAKQSEMGENQKLYGVINGGMPYVHTHKSGIDSLELFAEQCGFTWMGGFVLGGGAMLDGRALEKHLSSKKVVPAFDAFTQHILEGEPSPDVLYTQAQTPPGIVMTHVFARLLSFLVTRKLKKQGLHPSDKYPCVR